MCLYPRLYTNKKYTINKKNGGNVPECKDKRTKYVPIGCGNCIECRKQKAREWQIRLHEELKECEQPYFVTLTINNEKLEEVCKEVTEKDVNNVAKYMVRHYLERIRKKNKKSIKHWFITELGETNTERIHLHGIIFTNKDINKICDMWGYGNYYIGNFCNEQTVNYMIKYVMKVDQLHKGYKPKILSSPGIGRNFTKSYNFKRARFRGEQTKEEYILPSGRKTNLPVYYRNKLYTEEEREQLWIQKLDTQETYLMGEKYRLATPQEIEEYLNALKTQQEKNERMGYGNDNIEWKPQKYKVTLKMLNKTKKN